jgi:hypothetical protein
MNLYQCQEKAKDIGYDKAQFFAEFPNGTFLCTWKDAYFGFFKIENAGMDDSFVMTKQIDEMFPNLVCTEPFISPHPTVESPTNE